MNVTKRNIGKLYGCLLKHIGAVDFIVRDTWCAIAFYDYNGILHGLQTSPNSYIDAFRSTRLFKMYCSSKVYPGPIDYDCTLSKFAVDCGFTEAEVKIALVRDIVYHMKYYQLFSVDFSSKLMQYQAVKNYEELAVAFDLAQRRQCVTTEVNFHLSFDIILLQ